MTLTHGFTTELKMLTGNATLGSLAGELLNTTLDRIGLSVNTPMYLSASFPTSDSLLNIGSSLVESGDGSGKSIAPLNSTIPAPTSITTINFQTGSISGQTVQVDGGSFALPTGTVGYYRRMVFVLRDDGSIDTTFSTEVASLSSLDNAGTLLASLLLTPGLPIGWIDLECDDTAGKYRTAGSSTSIIENKVGSDFRIVRITGGSSGGGGGDVSAEAAARLAADSTLQAHINAEITARDNADVTLQNNINSEITARTDSDVTLQANINAEITARDSADGTLQSHINTEITARTNANVTLQIHINTEITARTEADSDLQSAVDAEVTARMDATSTLQANLNTEATTRSNADVTLQNNINSEITTRSNADVTLQTNIDAEITARTLADSTINSAVITGGSGISTSGTLGSGLNVSLGALTADWDASAYNVSVKTPTSAAHATTKEYVDQIAITGGIIKEALLSDHQLKTGAGVAGILAAETVYFNTNPSPNDTIVVTNGTTTETYTFKASRSVAFEVAIGGSAIDTMNNLYTAINTDSVAWISDYAIDGLDAINTNGVVIFIEKNAGSGASPSRIYGTWTTQTDCKIVEFYDLPEYRTSKAAINLPTSDPAAGRFGIRKAIADLVDGEIHDCLESDTLRSWHLDTYVWLTLSGSGSLPDATAASGGAIKGKVTFDSDLGLDVASGIAKVKIDNSTIKFDMSGQLIADQTLLNTEITARSNADLTLQNNINTEITTRSNADLTLQSNINSELTARSNADLTLQSNINSEITARSNTDSTLQAAIAALPLTTDFNLSGIAGTDLTVKAGYLRLGDGRELRAVSDLTVSLIGPAEVTDVTFSQHGDFYDVSGTAKAVQLYDGSNAGHYFWFKCTDGSNTQTDPSLVGTGHRVDILAGTPAIGTIEISDLDTTGDSYFSITTPSPSQPVVTLYRNSDWYVPDTQPFYYAINSIVTAINSNIYLNGSNDSRSPYVTATYTSGTLGSGTIQVFDYTLLSGATITFGVGGLYTITLPITITEGVEWTASTDNNTTAASIQTAMGNYVNGFWNLSCGSITSGSFSVYGLPGDLHSISSSDATNLPTTGPTGGTNDYVTVTGYPSDFLSLTSENSYWIPVTGPTGGSNSDTSAQIATKFTNVVDPLSPFIASTIGVSSFVTNALAGTATDGSATGSAASIYVATQGAVNPNGNYYVYIDLTSLGSAASVNGRRYYPVTSSNILLSTLAPEFQRYDAQGYPTYYLPLGTVQKTGGSWVNAQTIATKEWPNDVRVENINPMHQTAYTCLVGTTPYGITINGIMGTTQIGWRLQATSSGTMTGLRLYFFNPSTSSVTVSLCADDAGGSQPGSVLASDSSTYASGGPYPTDGSAYPVSFSINQAVTAGTNYWIVIGVDSMSSIEVCLIDLPPIGISLYDGSIWSYSPTANHNLGSSLYLEHGYAFGFDYYNNTNKIVTTTAPYSEQIASNIIPVDETTISNVGNTLRVSTVTDANIRLSNNAYLWGKNYTGNNVVNILKVNTSNNIEFGSIPYTPASAPIANYQVANKKYVDDNANVSGEATARMNADSTLQVNLTNEISNRTTADNTEITARRNADSTLQTAINALTSGLVITPTTAAAISGTTLSNNRHYIIDMNAASGNISVNLPAVSSGLVIWLTVVRNKTNGYRVTVTPNGSDVVYYNGGSYSAATMYLLESWAQFLSDGTRWFVDDPSDGGTLGATPLGTISNITGSPSTADPDWAGVSATVTTTTTSGQLPLEGIVNSAISIVSSTNGGYARIRWTVPAALKGRRFMAEWHQIAGDASGDYKVEVHTNTASNYGGTDTKLSLTTDVTGISAIPNISGRYHTWFTTDPSLSYYEMRVIRTAASSSTIYLANVLVSPIIEEEEQGILFVNAGGTTAKPGDTIGADSTGGAFTITAPASPMPGARFRIIDVGGVAGTNNITIGRNGSNIASLAVDMDIDINWLDVTLTYYKATVGWAPSR